jgi:hypothetical protein
MNKKSVKTAFVCAAAALTLCGSGATSLSAAPGHGRDDEGQGPLHVTKECSKYTGAAGSFCTITSSNIAQIVVGSTVTYDQAAGIPAGILDSNVILDAGAGNRAIGRCTLDLATGLGLCTFSDGTGDLAGFRARVKVSPPTDGLNWHWNGVFSFDDDVDR